MALIGFFRLILLLCNVSRVFRHIHSSFQLTQCLLFGGNTKKNLCGWIFLDLFLLLFFPDEVQECYESYNVLPDVPNKQTETVNEHG